MIERSYNPAFLQNSSSESARNLGLSVPARQSSPPQTDTNDVVYEIIRQALHGLQFGEITITVRNGTVVQIERVARKRQFKSSHQDGSF